MSGTFSIALWPKRSRSSAHSIVLIGGLENAVDQKLLGLDTDLRQLQACTCRLVQCCCIRSAHQNKRRLPGIRQRVDGAGIQIPLIGQPLQRPHEGGARRRTVNKAGPGGRQGQEPQRMSRRRGIEDHMVESACDILVGEKLCELVEGRDLNGTGAGQLFFHAGDRRFRQHAPVRPDDLLTIGLGSLYRIDIEAEQSVDTRNG